VEEEEATNKAVVLIEDIDLYADDGEGGFELDNDLVVACEAVSKCHKICRFVKNSTLSKSKLLEIHSSISKLYHEVIREIKEDNMKTSDESSSGEEDDLRSCVEYYRKYGREGELQRKCKKVILDVKT
jgi:hypothetical protein